jgi:MFS family permease
VTPTALLRRARHAQGRLIAYLLSVQVVAQLSAPYFAPYMLKQLMFPYSTFMLMLGVAFVARITILPALGRIARRHGAKTVLWMGGLGIIPLSVLWLVSDSVPYLLMIQVLAGLAWASYELGTFLMLFETIPDDEKTSVLTMFNLVNALAVITGSVIGGVILHMGEEQRWVYHLLFAISSVGRIATLPLLYSVIERPPVPVPLWLRTMAVRPSAGAIDRPIVAAELEPTIPPQNVESEPPAAVARASSP